MAEKAAEIQAGSRVAELMETGNNTSLTKHQILGEVEYPNSILERSREGGDLILWQDEEFEILDEQENPCIFP